MFTFEIFTLDRETMCHNVELEIFKSQMLENSKSQMSDYTFALTEGMARARSLSLQMPNTLIELNMWDDERGEWVEEIVFENGVKIN